MNQSPNEPPIVAMNLSTPFDTATSQDLLRRFEPVLQFTRGERFFPADVDSYLASCSLWVQQPDTQPVCLVPTGELSASMLGNIHRAETYASAATAEPPTLPAHDHERNVFFLKYAEPLGAADLAQYQREWRQKERDNLEYHFRAGRGRLARVGYFSRLVDALFSISLFGRGRVPGDASAAAALGYEQRLSSNERYCYYGRVVQQGPWLVLQYWFFYYYNNWRTGFAGANDHEADWEMISIYLTRREKPPCGGTSTTDDTGPKYKEPEVYDNQLGHVFDEQTAPKPVDIMCYEPEWIAYASHDYQGDDLRRHWLDPEVDKVGEHPVIYVGAGSHAAYYRRGDYITEWAIPFLAPAIDVTSRIRQFWRETLRQYANQQRTRRTSNIFLIPFVDYARGDGVIIGPSAQLTHITDRAVKPWDKPRLLTTDTPWLSHYRGLWGLYTRDPFSGEDAPAGPMYNRDGSIRTSWYDPTGWAGLDKVLPASQERAAVQARQSALQQSCIALTEAIQAKEETLRNVSLDLEALRRQQDLFALVSQYEVQVEGLSKEVQQLRANLATEQTLLHALNDYAQQLSKITSTDAETMPPAFLRSHIHRAHMPEPESRQYDNLLAEIWSAASIGLIMIAFVFSIFFFPPGYMVTSAVFIVYLVGAIEAGFRRRLGGFASSSAVIFAVFAALMLLFEYAWQTLIVGALLIGIYLIWENVRELWA